MPQVIYLLSKVTSVTTSPQSLDTSITALVCIFSSILNCSETNQKNSVINGLKYSSRELLKAIFIFVKKQQRETNKQTKHAGSALNILQPQYMYNHNTIQYNLRRLLLPRSFRINLKDPSSHIAIDPLGVYLSASAC